MKLVNFLLSFWFLCNGSSAIGVQNYTIYITFLFLSLDIKLKNENDVF